MPARLAPDGADPPPEPARRRRPPRWPTGRSANPGSSGSWRKPPASTAAASCRTSTRTTSASGSRGIRPTPAPGRAGRWCCWTTASPPTTPPSVGRAAVRVLEAAGYRVELAGLACCGRPAISKGLLTLGRDLARENVARLVGHARAGTPIVGCEPSCLLTLVDEYRDFRIGPDADLVASRSHAGRCLRRRPRARPRACPCSRARAGSCSTAIASRRRWWARRGRSRPCGGSPASRSRSSTRAAAGWRARSATSAAITT